MDRRCSVNVGWRCVDVTDSLCMDEWMAAEFGEDCISEMFEGRGCVVLCPKLLLLTARGGRSVVVYGWVILVLTREFPDLTLFAGPLISGGFVLYLRLHDRY